MPRLNLLLISALSVDLFAPILITQGLIPSALRWISHAAVAAMIGLTVLMLARMDRVPWPVWVVVVLSGIGMSVSIINGEGPVTAIWGWWVWLPYPLVAIFGFLQHQWPDDYPRLLRRFCLGVVTLQLAVQVVQYAIGVTPGDDLSGTFGRSGTGALVLFLLFALCLSLGQWLAQQRWTGVMIVLVFGAISSVLGEMKLFPVAAVAACGLALVADLWARRSLWRIIPMGGALVLGVGLFVVIYDAVEPGRPLTKFTSDRMAKDLGMKPVRYSTPEGYRIRAGRNYAVALAWKSNSRDPGFLFFGRGMGARSESKTLGTKGTGLQHGTLVMAPGSALASLIAELGLMGILLVIGFMSITTATLLRRIREFPQDPTSELYWGLLLFTLLWPVWLWYGSALGFRVAMLLYWASLGYALRPRTFVFEPVEDVVLEPETVDLKIVHSSQAS